MKSVYGRQFSMMAAIILISFTLLGAAFITLSYQYDGGPHEANFLKLDCSRIKSVFGWRPRYGVEEAVQKTVEWSRAYLDGEDMLEVMDRQITEFFS